MPSQSRHRAKPKFDIPATEPVETPAGWVYRGEPEKREAEQTPEPPKQAAVPEPSETPRNPYLMVGEGLVLIGMGSMILTYRAAMGMMTMPMRLAGILRRE